MIEEELLRRAQGGEREAVEEILLILSPRLHRFGQRLCHSFAEDALQEALLKVAQELPNFRGESELSTWAFSIVRSACARQSRGMAHTHTQALEEGREEGRHHNDPEKAALHRERKELFNCALNSLSNSLREVLLLRDVEELSAKQSAEVLGLTVPAMKSRLHRSRRALSLAIDEQLRVGTPRSACPDVLTALSKEREGELLPEECERLSVHLAGCEECDAACSRLKDALAECRAVDAGELGSAEIVAKVRGAYLAWREASADGA